METNFRFGKERKTRCFYEIHLFFFAVYLLDRKIALTFLRAYRFSDIKLLVDEVFIRGFISSSKSILLFLHIRKRRRKEQDVEKQQTFDGRKIGKLVQLQHFFFNFKKPSSDPEHTVSRTKFRTIRPTTDVGIFEKETFYTIKTTKSNILSCQQTIDISVSNFIVHYCIVYSEFRKNRIVTFYRCDRSQTRKNPRERQF